MWPAARREASHQGAGPGRVRPGVLRLFLAFALLAAQTAWAQVPNRTFSADLSAGAVVPATGGAGTGFVVAVLQGYLLDITVSFSGLDSPVASDMRGGMHLHRGPAGENGPILAEIAAPASTSGLVDARLILDDAQIEALEAGELYLQIHTVGRMGGALRGQLEPTD